MGATRRTRRGAKPSSRTRAGSVKDKSAKGEASVHIGFDFLDCAGPSTRRPTGVHRACVRGCRQETKSELFLIPLFFRPSPFVHHRSAQAKEGAKLSCKGEKGKSC